MLCQDFSGYILALRGPCINDFLSDAHHMIKLLLFVGLKIHRHHFIGFLSLVLFFVEYFLHEFPRLWRQIIHIIIFECFVIFFLGVSSSRQINFGGVSCWRLKFIELIEHLVEFFLGKLYFLSDILLSLINLVIFLEIVLRIKTCLKRALDILFHFFCHSHK